LFPGRHCGTIAGGSNSNNLALFVYALSAFVNDEAVFKILYLAIRNASEKWTMPIKEWGLALNQFAIIFGKERVPF
jgi:transposase-like protein